VCAREVAAGHSCLRINSYTFWWRATLLASSSYTESASSSEACWNHPTLFVTRGGTVLRATNMSWCAQAIAQNPASAATGPS
jgi:hypothetical protein